MTHDGMRGVDLEYNSLNLVSKVKQGNTANATYRWLADGTKAGVIDNDGNGFEYLGSFVYQRDASGLNLESVGFSNGRFVASSTGEMTPYYHITDHLGSVRTVIDKNIEVVAQNNYYAFGLRHENPNLAQHTSNRYLYNGKEEQTTGGVDLLDYGARTYDPRILRWTQVDPLAEKMTSFSPYAYTFNNPIIYIDPDGKYGIKVIYDKSKTIMITANYYVQTGDRAYYTNDGKTKYMSGYTKEQVTAMGEQINGYLNGLNGKVTEGDYAGYSVYFNLNFIEGGTPTETKSSADADYYEGNIIGNTIGVGSTEIGEGHFPINADGSVRGGYAEDKQYIIMNRRFDTLMNKIHEIFHTLGFGDGAKKGIMNYPPRKPNRDDINNLGNSKFLPEIKRKHQIDIDLERLRNEDKFDFYNHF